MWPCRLQFSWLTMTCTCSRINPITIVHVKYTRLLSTFSYMQFAENNSVRPAKPIFQRRQIRAVAKCPTGPVMWWYWWPDSGCGGFLTHTHTLAWLGFMLAPLLDSRHPAFASASSVFRICHFGVLALMPCFYLFLDLPKPWPWIVQVNMHAAVVCLRCIGNHR